MNFGTNFLPEINLAMAVDPIEVTGADLFMPTLFPSWLSETMERGRDFYEERFLGAAPYQGPTVYGLEHVTQPDTMAQCEQLVRKAKRLGAKTVGLEGIDRTQVIQGDMTFFSQMNQIASHHGLRTVFLEQYKIWIERTAFVGLSSYVNAEGRLDLHLIRAEQERLQRSLLAYRDMLKNESLRIAGDISVDYIVGRMREIEAYWEVFWLKDALVTQLMGTDFEAIREQWYDRIVHQADAEMARAIKKERPDVVFVGAGHLLGLKMQLGNAYRYHLLMPPFKAVVGQAEPAIKKCPLAMAALEDVYLLFGPTAVRIAEASLIGFIKRKHPLQSSQPNSLPGLLEPIFEREPRFIELLMRWLLLTREGPSYDLSFAHGHDVLAMEVREIKERIDTAA